MAAPCDAQYAGIRGMLITGPAASTCHTRIRGTLHRRFSLVLPGLGPVGAARPPPPPLVLRGEVPGAVVGVRGFGGDLRACLPEPLVQRVGLVGDHVGAELPRAGRAG